MSAKSEALSKMRRKVPAKEISGLSPKHKGKHDYGLPAGEKVTTELVSRFKKYYRKHAGYGDIHDKGHMLRQNNYPFKD